MSNKLDNEPYDRGQIAIHEDFYASASGFWLVSERENIYFSEESYMWHLAQAQECVDDIIYDMMNYD